MKRTLLVLFVMAVTVPSVEAGTQPPVTGILAAFKAEIIFLSRHVSHQEVKRIMGIDFVQGRIGSRSVVYAESGVGKVNAAMTTTLMIEHFKPEQIIITGTSGGVDPALMPGDIVVATKTTQHDQVLITDDGTTSKPVRNPMTREDNPVFFTCDQRLVRLALHGNEPPKLSEIRTEQGVRQPRIVSGVVVSGDAFIASSQKKRQLFSQFSASVVDMESAAIAQISHEHDVPFAIVRSLSNSAGEQALAVHRDDFVLNAQNSIAIVVAMVGLMDATSPVSATADSPPG